MMNTLVNILSHQGSVGEQQRLVASFLLILCGLVLSGCSGATQPFAKTESVGDFRPPLNNFSAAGPGAECDIDYETLYGPGRVATADTESDRFLDKSINVPAERLTANNTAVIESPAIASDGEASKNRTKIKAVAVLKVRGALGKGNDELTAALRNTLSSVGWPVVTKPRKDALTISGKVNISPPEGDTQKVTLAWTVASSDGRTLGTISQTNRVSPGSIDKSWGKTASYAAQGAAAGIFDLVQKLRVGR